MQAASYCIEWMVIVLQEYGMTALAVAAYGGCEEVVNVLLNAGANPNIQDNVSLLHH